MVEVRRDLLMFSNVIVVYFTNSFSAMCGSLNTSPRLLCNAKMLGCRLPGREEGK